MKETLFSGTDYKNPPVGRRKRGSDIMRDLPSRNQKLLSLKKKVALGAAGTLLAAASITAGTAIVPSDFEIPVLLANGEVITPPWYVTVEGECVALVDSRDDARKVVKQVANYYKSEETIDLEIKERTSSKEMNLKNGDEKPDILTVEEAADEIASKQELTVKTTELSSEEQPVRFETITKKTKKLYKGQTKVKQEGRKGRKEVIKEVTKENGQTVEEQVLEETVLQEPEPEITLKGTRERPEPAEPASAKMGTGRLSAPVSQLNVTSGFGPRWGRTHLGVDLAMPQGSSICAADGGTVIFTGYCGSYGNLVKLDHGNGIVTYYAHCSQILTEQGARVKKGDCIAKVGSTGNSTGPHLHFEVRVNGENVDPMGYL